MQSLQRNALLVGATGLVGGYCLKRLLTDDTFSQVTVLTRRSLAQNRPKLIEVIVDFDRLAEYGENIRADTVFCCLGTTLKTAGSQQAFARVDHDYVVELARLSAQQGVGQFLLISAIGADPGSRIFYNRVKGLTEEAVKVLPFRTVHILRPSLLLGPRREWRPAEAVSQRILPLFSGLLQGPLRKYRPVQAETVAAKMVELAKTDRPGIHVDYF